MRVFESTVHPGSLLLVEDSNMVVNGAYELIHDKGKYFIPKETYPKKIKGTEVVLVGDVDVDDDEGIDYDAILDRFRKGK